MTRLQRSLALAARLGLGLVFVAAAVPKLADLSRFTEDVANYRLLPPAAVPFLAASLPGIELVVGLALCAGLFSRAAAAMATAMLGAFTVAVAQALERGIDLRCGCFGGSEPLSGWTLARDLALLAVSVGLLLAPSDGTGSARAPQVNPSA